MKKTLWAIIFVVALAVSIIGGYYIASYFLSDGGNTRQYIEKNTDVSVNSGLAENHNINWKKLKKTNSDIYSWIYIPNTKVDYPVVCPFGDKDDDFYLNRNIEKEYEFAGSIYSQKQNNDENNPYLEDPVTVLYGHNMNNGTMFKTLHYFENPEFFEKNEFIYIYMPKRRLTFKIYSAYVYDDRHILNSFNFDKPKILKKYQKYTLNPDSLTKNTRQVELDSNSKILTLSTCTNGAENTRYLVQGVLIKDEPTN